MINHARAVTEKVTDYQPGSVVRTIIEAPAVEIEELYLQMFLGLRDAIPVATFRSFGFDKLPASMASGWVSVSSETPQANNWTIPAGTTFSTEDGRTYVTSADVLWASGASIINLYVQCTEPGSVGNVGVGAINTSGFFGIDAFTISNGVINNGRDVETDSEREARFAEFIQSLSRGTVYACLNAAKMAVIKDQAGNVTEYVTKAGLFEQPGQVAIYIYSSYGVPSADLIETAQTIIDGSRNELTGEISPGFRSAGVRMDIFPMVERAVPLSISVEMIDGYQLTTSVRQRLGDIFGSRIRSVQPGTMLYLQEMVESLLVVPGIKRIVPQTTSNFFCAVSEALTPGTLTIAAL